MAEADELRDDLCILMEDGNTKDNSDAMLEIVLGLAAGIGSDWKEVRHVVQGTRWHKATDQLRGTDSYGTPYKETSNWSIPFADDDFSEFLFMTSNGKYWMVMEKNEVLGSYYSNEPKNVPKSSLSCSLITPKMYRRKGSLEDPWLSLRDHETTPNDILYGENAGGHTALLNANGGASVYIR